MDSQGQRHARVRVNANEMTVINPSGYSSVIFVFTFASCVGPTSPERVPAIAVPEHCSKMALPSRLFVLLIVWWQPGHVDARFFLITPVDVSPFTSHILGRLP